MLYLNLRNNDTVGAAQGEYGQTRRLLANNFTSAAMLEQEPLVKGHIDLFIQQLGEKTDNGKVTIDHFHWLAYCTFHIIGDVSFGEPFGCLRESMMHPWICWIFANIKLTPTLVPCKRIPYFYSSSSFWNSNALKRFHILRESHS